MKTIKILSTLMFLLFSVVLSAQTETRKILSQNSYTIGKTAELSIIHKFGTITIKNHKADRIDSEVAANIKVIDDEEIEKLLENISINMRGNEDGLRIETIFDDNIAGNSKNSATIDITILMPDHVSVFTNHKFGNTTIENLAGKTNINCEYGNVIINSLGSDDNKIKILHSTLNINNFLSATIKSEHSTIDIGRAGAAKIESVFSPIKCHTADNLRLTLEGGNVELTNVGYLQVESNFSTIEIKNLELHLKAESDYTSLTVQTVRQSFNVIEIDATFSTIDINFGFNPDFRLTGNLSYSKFAYPENEWKNITKSNDVMNIMLNGFAGAGQSPALVNLSGSYGKYKFR
jgi:hypothetical protein